MKWTLVPGLLAALIPAFGEAARQQAGAPQQDGAAPGPREIGETPARSAGDRTRCVGPGVACPPGGEAVGFFDPELHRDGFGTPIGACDACLDLPDPARGCMSSQWNSTLDPEVPPLRVRKFVPPPDTCAELVQAEIVVRGSLCGVLRVENRDPDNGCTNAMALGVQFVLEPPPDASFLGSITLPLEIADVVELGPFDGRADYDSPPGWDPPSGVTIEAAEMDEPELRCVRITDRAQLAAFVFDGTGSEDLEFQHSALDVSSTSGCAPISFKSDPFAGVEVEVHYVYCAIEPVTAVADQGSVCSGESVTIDVTANDLAPFGSIDCGSISIVVQPQHGLAAIQGCDVVYTSDGSTFDGTDTFSYVVSDVRDVPCYGDPAVVSIDVLRTIARNDSFIQVCDNATVDIPVLLNDSTSRGEVDPDSLAITVPPEHGSVEIVDCVVVGEPTRCLRYLPAPGHQGPDTFRYEVSGGVDVPCFDDALVSLTVCATTAAGDAGSRACRGGPPILLSVSDNDSATCAGLDCSATTIVSPPAHGSARPVGCAIEYTPPADFAGVVTFEYGTCSALAPGCCDTAEVSVEICETVALDDLADVCQGESVSIPIADNDGSSCGTLDCSRVSLSAPPAHGQAFVQGCTIVYDADQPGFSGLDTLSYSIEDDLGCAASASVSVRVHARPSAVDDRAVKQSGSLEPLVVPVLDNDGPGAGCTLDPPVQIVRQGRLGTFSPNPDGSVTYTPFPGFPEGGQDSGSYSIANLCATGGDPIACPAAAEILIEEAPDCLSHNRRRPGSLLLFPEYDNRGATQTYLTLTNTNCDEQSGTVRVRLHYVDAEDCLKNDFTVTLSPCDTWTAITEAHDPNSQRGFVYAYCQSIDGAPIAFDHIIGNEIVFDGAGTLTYGIDAVSFRAMVAEGQPTDLDGDGIRDLDGLEYAEAPDRLLIPRFLGQDPASEGIYHSELVLINLSGGKQFTTIVDFLIYNDDEETFSASYSFYCWDKAPLAAINAVFLQEFLVTTQHDPLEILGFPARESGWFRIDGHTASSTAETITDPAVYAVLVERADPLCVADLPWEECGQGNGDLCPMGIFGDGPAYAPNDDQ